MIGNERHRWDRTQASFFCALIAVLSALPTWFALSLLGGLS